MTPEPFTAGAKGVLGGSFNPPHLAHVEMARRALNAGEVDTVAVIPSFAHPFRKDLESFDHRVAMCRLAFAPLAPAIDVLEIERDLGGLSYTVDTIRELLRRNPDTTFRLLVGSDILPDLGKWKEHEALVALAPLIVFPRLSEDAESGSDTLPPYSSTSIRDRLATGQSVSHMLPASVLDYIRQHGLYGTSRPQGPPSATS